MKWSYEISIAVERPASNSVRASILKNHGRCFLADHNRGCIGITADDLWHDRGVGDAQARDAVHPQTRIDDSVGSSAHAAGANRMKVRDAAIAQVLDQVLLAGNQRSRHNFLGDI